MEKRKRNNEQPQPGSAERLVLTYYTDPLCCWSWAFMQVIDKWRAASPHAIEVRFCMGGMLSGWDDYRDELRAVNRPIQMGPVWMEARNTAGIPLDDTIWFRDPPSSSYPACLAVKAATLQSAAIGEQYLRAVQAAVMTGGRNIAKKEVLLDVAKHVPGLDLTLFEQQLKSPEALAALKADFAEVQNNRINRFPSLLVARGGVPGKVLLTGYRPQEALEASIHQLVNN